MTAQTARICFYDFDGCVTLCGTMDTIVSADTTLVENENEVTCPECLPILKALHRVREAENNAYQHFENAAEWIGAPAEDDSESTRTMILDELHEEALKDNADPAALAAIVPAPAPKLPTLADKVYKLVLNDIKEGVFPTTVRSFTDLHDHVDANMYLEDAGQVWQWNTEDEHDALIVETNAITDEVSRRLAERADAKRLEDVRKGDAEPETDAEWDAAESAAVKRAEHRETVAVVAPQLHPTDATGRRSAAPEPITGGGADALLAPVSFDSFGRLAANREQASKLVELLNRHVDLEVVALDNDDPQAAALVRSVITAAKCAGLKF